MRPFRPRTSDRAISIPTGPNHAIGHDEKAAALALIVNRAMVGRPEPGLTDFHIAFRVMAGMAGVATAGVLRLAPDAGGELSGRVVQRAGS